MHTMIFLIGIALLFFFSNYLFKSKPKKTSCKISSIDTPETLGKKMWVVSLDKLNKGIPVCLVFKKDPGFTQGQRVIYSYCSGRYFGRFKQKLEQPAKYF